MSSGRTVTSVIAILAATVGATACDSSPRPDIRAEPAQTSEQERADRERAEELCQRSGLAHAREFDADSELVLSDPTSEVAFRRWDRERRAEGDPQPLGQPRSERGAGFMALCTYRGEFIGFPRGPEGPDADPYGWLVLSVFDDGGARVFEVSAPSDPGSFRADAPARRPPPPDRQEVADPSPGESQRELDGAQDDDGLG